MKRVIEQAIEELRRCFSPNPPKEGARLAP